MSAHINIAKMVETILLRRILVVIRLAHCVVVGPSYESLSPPTVMHTRCVSVLLGRIDTTIRPYVTLLPAGTHERWMKKMLFVSLMPFLTPCAILPISLDNAVVQVPLSGPCISCVYHFVFPVEGSSTLWKAMAPSPTVSTVRLDCARERRGYLWGGLHVGGSTLSGGTGGWPWWTEWRHCGRHHQKCLGVSVALHQG